MIPPRDWNVRGGGLQVSLDEIVVTGTRYASRGEIAKEFGASQAIDALRDTHEATSATAGGDALHCVPKRSVRGSDPIDYGTQEIVHYHTTL